ncbi:MAG: hypothetical protein OES24_00975 [Acidimicrobiia bacterium]|nr:hypothetical protein [Acidimicrobiia bacterium]
MLTLVRRVAAALGLTGLIAMLFRLRGRGGVPPQTGGWRELTEVELAGFLADEAQRAAAAEDGTAEAPSAGE